MSDLFDSPTILYEDDDVAVINKPPGLVVNRAETVQETTIQDWWMNQLENSKKRKKPATEWQKLIPPDFSPEYGTPTDIFDQRGGIVHRLDKETSGALVLAKNPGALVHLLQQFRLRQTQKTYTCLVHGKFHIAEDTLRLPLGRSLQNRTKFAVDSEGRIAETTYKVQHFYRTIKTENIIAKTTQQTSDIKNLKKRFERAYQGFSLVSCQPRTGRTHQIRVHMAHIKHPIVSDITYLGKKRSALDAFWCPRLFLHASEITFIQPQTGREIVAQAPLWPDLENALSYVIE